LRRVAQNSKPIINGNPAVEPRIHARIRKGVTELRSALAVPLKGVNGVVGVLALYRAEGDAFTTDHLRVLQVITSKVALFIENALGYCQAERSAISDYLTGLSNVRALFIHLDQELARCKREKSTVGVIGCDLNGYKQIDHRWATWKETRRASSSPTSCGRRTANVTMWLAWAMMSL
jgi:GAF domain-containing protein